MNRAPGLDNNIALGSYFVTSSQVVAWLSGSALFLNNVVTLHQARLVLGWVTVCKHINHLGV